MADINPTLVKTLREKTNAGMMDCKRALSEAGGDLEKAESILRLKGIASAGKKASRAAKEGVIISLIQPHGKVGVLAEINCETDFVAKNDIFRDFVKEVAEQIAGSDASKTSGLEALLAQPFINNPAISLQDAFAVKIASLGERILLRRFERFAVGEESGSPKEGIVSSYIHLQGKVGVLVEINCESENVAKSESFRGMVKDITLQIAAAHPTVVSRDQVDPALVSAEREIYKTQVQGKPEPIIEKIVDGKMDKFYSTICLLEQACIKNPDITVKDLLAAKAAELGEKITIRRFARYMVGEEAAGAVNTDGEEESA